MIRSYIPDTIWMATEFFGPSDDAELTEARVLTIFRDSTGDQWVAFESMDYGVSVIHLGSNFFRGFSPIPEGPR